MKYLCSLFIVLCLAGACKDDPIVIDPVEIDDEVKFILDGSIFNNQFISFSDFLESQTSVGYIDSINATEVKTLAQFNNSPVSFWLRFPGKTVGLRTYNEPNPPLFDYPADNKYFEVKIGNDTILGGLAIQQINLNVLQYDTIGGRIKGTFSGVVYDYTTGIEAFVEVKNGEFDMKRKF